MARIALFTCEENDTFNQKPRVMSFMSEPYHEDQIQPPLAQKLNFRMYKMYIIHYVLLHGIYPLVGLHQKSYSFVAIIRLISDTTNSWVNTMRKDFHVVFYKIMHRSDELVSKC